MCEWTTTTTASAVHSSTPSLSRAIGNTRRSLQGTTVASTECARRSGTSSPLVPLAKVSGPALYSEVSLGGAFLREAVQVTRNLTRFRFVEWFRSELVRRRSRWHVLHARFRDCRPAAEGSKARTWASCPISKHCCWDHEPDGLASEVAIQGHSCQPKATNSTREKMADNGHVQSRSEQPVLRLLLF